MSDWTLAVEAVRPGLSAVAVEDEQCVALDTADLEDGDVDALTRSFAALAGSRETFPDHLLMVVPGDVVPERFAALAEAAGLAGLPDPSWLPDAVARAGGALAEWAPGTAAVVLDARTADVAAWPVRTAADGIRIAATGALDVSARLDDLLAGMVHAKLSLAAPDFAEAIRTRSDPPSRRDAAHLARELRRGRRLLSESGGNELIVSTGDAEISIGREEFVGLVDHALHDVLDDVRDDGDTPIVIVADERTPIVEHLSAATGGAPVDDERGPALSGAAALARPRDPGPSGSPADPTPSGPTPVPVTPGPAPNRPTPRPRWVVPALSALLVLAVSGAGAVLVAGPRSVEGLVPVFSEPSRPSRPSPVVPIGFDRLGPD